MYLRTFFAIFFLLCLSVADADAAKKKKNKKKPNKKPKPPVSRIVESSDFFTIEVSLKSGKKSKKYSVSCSESIPGVAKQEEGQWTFATYDALIKQLKKSKAKDKPATESKIKLYNVLKKAAKEECLEPDFLSLEPHKGEFTTTEAHILYNRFAFGGNPAQISNAVNIGLDKAVDQLLTIQADDDLEAMANEMRCDGYLANDTRNEDGDVEKCPPGNINAIREQGIRYDVYNRFWKSRNPFFHRFWFWLHDERMAASSSALSSCDIYALPDHVGMIRRAAFSGNYKQFMQDWNNDYLGHLIWLDGASNTGESPNENYAREFWELGTLGATGLTGLPNYNDFDIINSALAFSGWLQDSDKFIDAQGEEYWVCYGAKATKRHAPGMKTVFAGTPFEKNVDTDQDVLEATFAHERTAESLAEGLWKEYVNPYADARTIKKLAKIIRDNNYMLLPVFKQLMKSRAVYAARSRNSLIKHPVELVFGFLRQTGIPMYDHTYFSQQQNRDLTGANVFEILDWNVIGDLAQTPTRPPTVFGWNQKRLAGELYVLPWRNAAMYLVNQDVEDLQEKTGFSFRDRFFNGLPVAGLAAPALVERVSTELGLTLNEAQKAHLVRYLDYTYVQCSNSEKNNPSAGCDSDGNRLKYEVFDPHPESSADNVTDVRGLLAILAMLPEYRLK